MDMLILIGIISVISFIAGIALIVKGCRDDEDFLKTFGFVVLTFTIALGFAARNGLTSDQINQILQMNLKYPA